MNYGPNIPSNVRRGAYHVDRILKGTTPADLPVELTTTFELVINLKTTQALGLTIPQQVLLQATEVIQQRPARRRRRERACSHRSWSTMDHRPAAMKIAAAP